MEFELPETHNDCDVLKRKRIFRIIAYILIFHVVVLLLVRFAFLSYAKNAYHTAAQEKPYEVVIVPGVPYEHGSISQVMKMRVLWAKYLYDNGLTENIIFSGSAVYTPYVEGMIMKIMADSLGISPDNTYAEGVAEHSTENLYYGWKLAREKGFKKIALASDPFQSAMLTRFRNKYFPDVTVIPIVFGMLDFNGNNLPEINAEAAYVDNFISIRERESFWQRMKGTLGTKVEEALKKQQEQ